MNFDIFPNNLLVKLIAFLHFINRHKYERYVYMNKILEQLPQQEVTQLMCF
jgi:hypothetical protein